MAICDQCTAAIRNLTSQGNAEERERTVSVTLPGYGNSSIHECWICKKFYQWLETEFIEVFETWSRESIQVDYALYGSLYIDIPGESRILSSSSMEILPLGYSRDIYGMGCEIGLDFATAQEFDKSQLRTPKSDRAGSIDFDLIRSWFQKCIIHHDKCREIPSTQWYPTRLLYLGPTAREVKLIISEHSAMSGPYITLSHRWGPQTYKKLESSTIAELQNSIDIASLPQVFQDAIEVAHFLGIKYTWIDALCIKQDKDDLSDWEVESKNMGKVYTRALLNVAATLSEDGSESLFKQKAWGAIFPSEIDLEVDGILQKYYVFDSNIWNDEIANAPLNQRGWVFQERVLARRVLHFGQHQMGWECNEVEALGVFPNGLPTPNSLSFMSKSTTSKMIAAPHHELSQPLDVKFVEQRQNLVNLYSKCKLTFSKDKLIAFDGIAKGITSTGTDQYITGMWEYSLLYDLPWYRYASDREAFPIMETISRAPSWSWASVDGEITFPTLMGGVKRVFAGARFSKPDLEESCSILTKGLCFTVNIEWLNEAEIASFEVLGHHFILEDETFDSSMEYEISVRELRELAQQRMVLLMPLFATPYFLNAILLAEIPESGSYRRLGAVTIELLKEREAQTVQSEQQVSETEPQIDQNKSSKYMWNKVAFDFISSIADQQGSIQIVDIV